MNRIFTLLVVVLFIPFSVVYAQLEDCLEVDAGEDVAICIGDSVQLDAHVEGAGSGDPGSLATFYNGGNGCWNGNMFDLTTNDNAITITSMDVYPRHTEVQDVTIWYKEGTYVGFITNPGAWTMVSTHTINGIQTTPINVDHDDFTIPANTTYGIYVQFYAEYTNGNNTFSNADLTFQGGVGLCDPFGGINDPRTWNGVIYYDVVGTDVEYEWSPAIGLSATDIPDPVASPAVTTTYTLTATSQYCYGVDEVTVFVNPLPIANATNTGPYCVGENIVLHTQEIPGATYYWSGPGGWTANTYSPTIPNAAMNMAGTYTVEVISSEGCYNSSNTQVIVNPNPVASATNTGPYCAGDNIELSTPNVSGGSFSWTGPVGWSSDSQSPVITNSTTIMSGTYELLVTSEHGCTNTSSTDVTVNPIPIANATNTGPYCFGEDIHLHTPIIPDATYLWSGPNNFGSVLPGPVIQDADSAQFGTYYVTVTSIDGCTNTSSTQVVIDPGTNVELSIVNEISCYGFSDGEISLSLSEGSPPYHINWGVSFAVINHNNYTITNLSAGNYTITVTDSNWCAGEFPITLTEPTELVSYIAEAEDQHCLTYGYATVSGYGGVPPYSYQWPGTAGSVHDSTALELTEGNYNITITDANQCQTIQSVTIGKIGNVNAFSTVVGTPDCYGNANGQINISISDGTAPYSINWGYGIVVTEESGYNISGVTAGKYTITVTDSHGCKDITESTIIEPGKLIAVSRVSSDYNGLHISCHGANDAKAIVDVSGGTGPYFFQWCQNANNSTSRTVENLGPGTYMVTVTDINGCEDDSYVTVEDTERFTAVTALVSEITCFGASNGSAKITVDGGVGPYKYSWGPSAGYQVSKEAVNLGPGTHFVTVTDLNKCETGGKISLTQPNPINAEYFFKRPTCIGNNDGYLEFSVTGGLQPYHYYFNGNFWPNEFIDNIKAGNYTIEIRDRNNCLKKLGPIKIEDVQEECIIVPNAFSPNGDGINDNWEIKNIERYPQATIKVYNRWGQLIYEARGDHDPWDGKYEGKLLPTGTYVYFIQLYEHGEPISGNITIVY